MIVPIFEITRDAYRFDGTNDDIDFKIFKQLAERAKPLVDPRFSCVLEHDGKIVGFGLSYTDIQSDVRWWNKFRKYGRWIQSLTKPAFFLRIKVRRHPVVMLYVAKAADCPVKWAFAHLAIANLNSLEKQNYEYLISAYNATESGSKATLPAEKTLISKHFLMSKPL